LISHTRSPIPSEDDTAQYLQCPLKRKENPDKTLRPPVRDWCHQPEEIAKSGRLSGHRRDNTVAEQV
jgi:hypothetical protein